MNTYYKSSNVNTNTISDSMYHLIIGLTLMWGFGVNLLILLTVPVEAIKAIPGFVLIAGYFILCIAGQSIYNNSDDPKMSFLGYNMIVVPVGIIIAPYVAAFDPSIAVESFLQMTLITGVMMMLGVAYPKFFEKTIGVAAVILLALIISQLVSIFVLGGSLGLWYNYAIIGLMSIFIGYHWGKGVNKTRTVDNAIDTGADVYLPMVNIFLSLFGINSNND